MAPSVERASSPRIDALQRKFAERGAPAIDAFWAEVEEIGAPLIESVAGDGEHSLVTFLWRLEGEARGVGLIHGPLRPGDLPPLERLGESNLFHITYRVPNDLRNAYWLIPDPPRSLDAESAEEWRALQILRQAEGFMRPDPLNRHRQPQRTDPLDPRTASPGDSVLEMPAAQQLPFDELGSDVARGSLAAQRFASQQLQSERWLWVYTPAGIDELSEPCDVLIVFDGDRAIDAMNVPATLDHLISEGRLRPTIAVFVENLPEHRSLELPCYEPFAEFLASELMPWLTDRYPVTVDASRTTLSGASYGGLAASFGALRHPELFGNVLSHSGSYWWEPIDREVRYIAPEERRVEWLTSAYASSPTLPIRFYLDAGTLEENPAGIDLRGSVRRFRDVLTDRQYEVTHHEFNGGHAFACWRYTFADGLLSLVGTGLEDS